MVYRQPPRLPLSAPGIPVCSLFVLTLCLYFYIHASRPLLPSPTSPLSLVPPLRGELTPVRDRKPTQVTDMCYVLTRVTWTSPFHCFAVSLSLHTCVDGLGRLLSQPPPPLLLFLLIFSSIFTSCSAWWRRRVRGQVPTARLSKLGGILRCMSVCKWEIFLTCWWVFVPQFVPVLFVCLRCCSILFFRFTGGRKFVTWHFWRIVLSIVVFVLLLAVLLVHAPPATRLGACDCFQSFPWVGRWHLVAGGTDRALSHFAGRGYACRCC